MTGVADRIARVAAAGLRAAGADALLRAAGDHWRLVADGPGRRLSRRDGPPVQILIYHRVRPGPAPFAIDAIPPERFRSQMEHLARAYRVLPLDEIRRRAEEGSLPARCAAVTFDDGYADNHEHALPILRSLGVPATVFVVTGCVGTGVVPWHDRVLRAFERTTRREAAIPGVERPEPLPTEAARRSAAFRTLARLKPLPEADRLAAVAAVASALDVPDAVADDRGLMLDWDRLRAMKRGGFAVGSHTVTHPILSRQPADRVWFELTESKRAIEAELGDPVTLFAYPNGRPEDYTAETVALLGRAGYRVAVTTSHGANEAADDPLRWRRGTPWEPDPARFALKLAYYRLAGETGPPAPAEGPPGAAGPGRY